LALFACDSMKVITTAQEYEAVYQQWHGQTIALVPTMGALHEGHASLIRKAREIGERVVVSIFVNPLQFGPQEDLSRYPRPKGQDLALCEELGVDVVFYPTVEAMYPEGMENVTRVLPPASLTDKLCGAYRPGHFIGVATVVLKLFNMTRPHVALFGEKDAQQLAVVKKMVRDLHLPVWIVGCPIVRDADGLALSSRNTYLKTDAEKQAALLLNKILRRIAEAVRQSALPVPARETMDWVARMEIEAFQKMLAVRDEALFRLQYLEAVDAETFEPADVLQSGVKLLIAAYVGDVRLIDNINL
jgi:pantoate--beta-alanine ligase